MSANEKPLRQTRGVPRSTPINIRPPRRPRLPVARPPPLARPPPRPRPPTTVGLKPRPIISKPLPVKFPTRGGRGGSPVILDKARFPIIKKPQPQIKPPIDAVPRPVRPPTDPNKIGVPINPTRGGVLADTGRVRLLVGTKTREESGDFGNIFDVGRGFGKKKKGFGNARALEAKAFNRSEVKGTGTPDFVKGKTQVTSKVIKKKKRGRLQNFGFSFGDEVNGFEEVGEGEVNVDVDVEVVEDSAIANPDNIFGLGQDTNVALEGFFGQTKVRKPVSKKVARIPKRLKKRKKKSRR